MRLLGETVAVTLAPEPESAMDCGEPVALSLMVTAPESAPPVAGVKATSKLQLAPAARVVEQP